MIKNKRITWFDIINTTFLSIVAIICLLPLLHILAISFSESNAVDSQLVKFLPVDFTLNAYKFVASDQAFYKSFGISVLRTVLGTGINMLITVLAAYPLSKSSKELKGRNFFVWFFMISILFNGGLIPTYLVVSKTNLINTIWALVIPCAVPVFNIILLHNFFKMLPKEIEESGIIDGASHWTMLFKIFIPLSKPALATLVLFVAVGHWNQWFDGLIYMNTPSKYPLQSYLQSIIVRIDINLNNIKEIEEFLTVTQRNSNGAKIVLAMLPIMSIYPFLQKYFAKGIVLGSVKG